MRLRLLVVEDDEALTDSWHKTIELRNADDDDLTIIETCARSYDEAMQFLDERTFDAAVIDLRLKVLETGGHHNQQGNEVVKAVAVKEAIPTVIYTGQPQEAEEFPEAPKIKVIDKGEPFSMVLDWLKSEAGLIQQMQNVQSVVKTDMAKVFQTSIWPRWKNWIDGCEQGKADLGDAVTRHFVSHLHAGLLHVSGEAHPEEWYFVPPVKSSSLSTGDIFSDGAGLVEILVTPRCDLENTKGEDTLQLAVCQDVGNEWDGLLQGMKSDNKNTAGTAMSSYRRYLQHRLMPRLHFLPRMKMLDGTSAGPWFIRFDHIRSIPRTEEHIADLKEKRFATLTPEFLPSLVERLGTFFSRIGSPNHSEP